MAMFSALDLLTFSTHEQDVIRCLVRRPRLTAPEIAQFTKIPLEQLESVLSKMVSDARLTQENGAGDVRFAVGRHSERPKRGGNGLLDSLFPT